MKRHTGQHAEQLACDYLQRQGLALLARNYRCRQGEIDLIMRQQDQIVFVEVRYRRSSTFGGPLASVNHAKQQKLIAAASHYLQAHHTQCAARFDVIGITADDRLDWIVDAFQAA